MIKNVFWKSLVIGLIALLLLASTVIFVVPRTSNIKITMEKAAVSDHPCESTDLVKVKDDSGSTANKDNIGLTGLTGLFHVPSVVERGDIAFCQNRPLSRTQRLISKLTHGYAEHALIYVGNNRFIESSAYIPWIFKGSMGLDLCKLGVLNTSIFLLNLWAKNIIYGKVKNASPSQKKAAVMWAENQTKSPHPYQFCFEPPGIYHKHSWWGCPNPNGTTYNPDTGTYFKEVYPDYWYCTEVIWAAYMHCNGESGLDLGAEWTYDKKDDSWHWWIGTDQMLSNVDQIYLYTDGEYGYPGTSEPLVESYQVDVGIDNVTIHGKLIDDGDERCHCYVTLISKGDKYCGFYNSGSIDTFSRLFKDLEPDTTYQWYAWAYNSLGKDVGEIKSFTTLPSST